uniref:ZP domain-containing protein n=1 Tax=Plectus sambesii TaxID=2011161 RepID=A0A914WHE1_9BILA
MYAHRLSPLRPPWVVGGNSLGDAGFAQHYRSRASDMGDRRPLAAIKYLLLVVIGAILPAIVESIAINNHILGQPEVVCLEEGVRVLINVERPFHGHVYVKGLFYTSGCHLDLTTDLQGTQEIVFDIPYRSECNVRRSRSLNPAGISYRTTVILQFHHLFLTKVDGAYSVTCFYQESEKQVSQRVEVSMLPTTELVSYQEMPACTYQVLSGSIDGPPVRHARIGDKLIHKWTCEPGPHGILVHSCFARNGVGTEYRLLDERGCAIDPVALGQLTYSNDLSMAHAEVHAFKFADQMLVHFQCQITICTKVENGCEGISPPTCQIDSNLPPPVIIERPQYQRPQDHLASLQHDQEVNIATEEDHSATTENPEFLLSPSPPPLNDGHDDPDGPDRRLNSVKESYASAKQPLLDHPQPTYRLPPPPPRTHAPSTPYSLPPIPLVGSHEDQHSIELERSRDNSREHEPRTDLSPTVQRRRPQPAYPSFRKTATSARAPPLPPLPSTPPEYGRPQTPAPYQQDYYALQETQYHHSPPQTLQYNPHSGSHYSSSISRSPPIPPLPQEIQHTTNEEASIVRHNIIAPAVNVIDPVSQSLNSVSRLPPIDGEELTDGRGANLNMGPPPPASGFRSGRVHIQEMQVNSSENNDVGNVLTTTVPPTLLTVFRARRMRSISEQASKRMKSGTEATKSAKKAVNKLFHHSSDKDVHQANDVENDKLQLLKLRGNTLDVTADDMLIFSLEEQPFEAEVEEAMEGKESGVRPQVLTHQRASDVCMTKATLTQLATVLALFFVTLLTLSG